MFDHTHMEGRKQCVSEDNVSEQCCRHAPHLLLQTGWIPTRVGPTNTAIWWPLTRISIYSNAWWRNLNITHPLYRSGAAGGGPERRAQQPVVLYPPDLGSRKPHGQSALWLPITSEARPLLSSSHKRQTLVRFLIHEVNMRGLEGITFHEGSGLAQLPRNIFGWLDDLDLQDDDDPPGNKSPTWLYSWSLSKHLTMTSPAPPLLLYVVRRGT